jgi:hypothetical protein
VVPTLVVPAESCGSADSETPDLLEGSPRPPDPGAGTRGVRPTSGAASPVAAGPSPEAAMRGANADVRPSDEEAGGLTGAPTSGVRGSSPASKRGPTGPMLVGVVNPPQVAMPPTSDGEASSRRSPAGSRSPTSRGRGRTRAISTRSRWHPRHGSPLTRPLPPALYETRQLRRGLVDRLADRRLDLLGVRRERSGRLPPRRSEVQAAPPPRRREAFRCPRAPEPLLSGRRVSSGSVPPLRWRQRRVR